MPKLLVGSEGVVVWVSKEDYEDSLKHKWYINRNGYPWGHVGGKRVLLHRWVADRIGLALDALIDHKDRDPKNARRENLRYATPKLNMFNKSIGKNNKSGYKGVHWSPKMKCWVAQITLDRKCRNLGYFEDPVSAAVVYDKAAIELFGEEYAATNLKLGLITEDSLKTSPNNKSSNRVTAKGSLGFRGVSRDKKRYKAYVHLKRKQIHVGTYSTPEDAARAYDSYVIENGLDRVTNASLGLL